jgi:hypothetical protein
LLVIEIWSRLESRAETQNSSTGNIPHLKIFENIKVIGSFPFINFFEK